MAGVPGSQPSNLGSPVPGMAQAVDAAKAVANTQVPAIDFDALQAEVDSGMAESMPSTSPQAAAQPVVDFDAIQSEADQEAQTLGEQVSDYGTELKARFKAGFGGSIEQKAKILKGIYGDANVEHDDEDIYVTKNGKKEKFTRGMLDMVGSVLKAANPAMVGYNAYQAISGEGHPIADAVRDVADLGKQAIVETVALPAEIAGGLAGAAALNPVTAALGVGAGRLAGGMAGERVATAVGDMMGAEFEEGETEGQKLKRAAIGGGVRAVLGFGFDKVASKIGTAAANRLAQREASRAAYLEAPKGTPEEVAQRAVGAAKEMMEDVNHLVDNGILQPVEGGNGAVLLPNQANTAVPEFRESAKAASETAQYRNFISKQGEMLAKAWDTVTKAGDEMAGKVLEGAAKMAPKNPGQTLSAADRAWGGTIGQYRKEAIANAGDQTFAAGRFQDAMNETALAAGFKPKPDGPTNMADFSMRTRPSADEVADKLSITKEQAQQFIDRMVKYSDRMFNSKGQLTLKEMDEMYNYLAVKTKDAFGKPDASRSFRGAFMRLRNGVRDDFSDAMGAENVLGVAKREEYNLAKQRFSGIKDAVEELSGMMESDEMTSKALSQYIFSGDKHSLDRISALKTVLETESPGAWDNVVSSWMETIGQKHAAPGDIGKLQGGLNWKGIEKELNAKPEVLEAVFGKEQAKSLMSLVRVGRQVQQSGSGFTPKDYAALANGIAQQAPGMKSNPIVVVRLLKGIGTPERSMREMLTRGGREEILKRVSEGNRSRVSKILDKVISEGTSKATSNMRMAPGGLMNPKNYVPDIRQLATPTAQTSQGMLTPSPDEE